MKKTVLTLFLSLFLFSPALCNDEKTVIRVGLSNQNYSSYQYQNIKLTSDDNISLIDMGKTSSESGSQTANFEANSIIEVVLSEGDYNIYVNDELKLEKLVGPLLFSSNQDMQIVGLNRKGPAKYKGMIEIKTTTKNPSYFNLINVVDMQNYLRGVVPNEMPISFGVEALKAQAIAARNYATNAQMSDNYDLVDSTASQVYYGSNSYRDITDNAIFETQGIYALYDEKPITALYFSTSPGITDDWDDVFGNGTPTNTHPYLKSRPDLDKYKTLETEKDIIEFYSSKDTGLDINSPKYRWSYEVSRAELEETLTKTLLQQSNAGLVSPKFNPEDKLEGLKEIKPLKRTQSGKIIELLIVAKSGEYKVKKELGIRRVLRIKNALLPSGNFFVETIGEERFETEVHEEKPQEENSAAEEETQEENKEEETKAPNKSFGLIKLFDYVSVEKYPQTFKFIGGGFGHGVGMSQFGAHNLAKKGEKYPNILKHYYTDIRIGTHPKTVLYNEHNISYKTDFYFDSKTYEKAYLYIANDKNVSEFPFEINEYDFMETKDIADNKLIKINITKYLKDGINTITFAPLTKENKNKTVIFRVDLL